MEGSPIRLHCGPLAAFSPRLREMNCSGISREMSKMGSSLRDSVLHMRHMTWRGGEREKERGGEGE